MRGDEEFCREIFESYLKERYGEEVVSLSPGPDPPDFLLDLGAAQFAVEVRRIVGFTTVAGQKREDRGWGAQLRNWLREFQKEVSGAPWLRGLYVVSMRPVADLKAVSSALRAGILKYVRETAYLVEAPGVWLTGRWRIRKYRGSTNQLTYSYSMGRGRRESEVRDEIMELVGGAVKEKNHKLRNERRQKILLLLDDYHYALVEAWAHSVVVKDSEVFAAIYRISEEAGCELLWGTDPRPFNVATSPAA